MNSESKIPGLRRARLAASNSNQSTSHKSTAASPLLTLLMPLLGGLVGGFLGNAALESAKSADAWRRFALTDVYRPMQQNFPECLQKRTENAKALGTAAFAANLIAQSIVKLSAQVSPTTPIGKMDSSPLEQIFKPINDGLVLSNKLNADVTVCWNQYMVRVDEMALALGMTGEIASRKVTYWQKSSDRLRRVEKHSAGIGAILTNPARFAEMAITLSTDPNKPHGEALKPLLRTLNDMHRFLKAMADAETEGITQDQMFHGELTNLFLPRLAARQNESFWQILKRSLTGNE